MFLEFLGIKIKLQFYVAVIFFANYSLVLLYRKMASFAGLNAVIFLL